MEIGLKLIPPHQPTAAVGSQVAKRVVSLTPDSCPAAPCPRAQDPPPIHMPPHHMLCSQVALCRVPHCPLAQQGAKEQCRIQGSARERQGSQCRVREWWGNHCRAREQQDLAHSQLWVSGSELILPPLRFSAKSQSTAKESAWSQKTEQDATLLASTQF